MTTSHRQEDSKGARNKGELGVLQQRVADLERLLKSEHRQAEAEKWQILHYINERVKELDCLYKIHEIGMRPNLTGQGYGSDFAAAAMNFAIKIFQPPVFRVTIAAFNLRARRVWEKNGFHQVQTFIHQGSKREFVVLIKDVDKDINT